MVTQSLIDYIKAQLGQNVQAEIIKSALRTAGWQNEDIDSGFRAVEALTTLSNLEVEPRRAEPDIIQQSGTGAGVKQPINGQKPMTDASNLEAETVRQKVEEVKTAEQKINKTASQTTAPQAISLSVLETREGVDQIEPKTDLQKQVAQVEQAEPVAEIKKPLQAPGTLSAEKFSREKRLEEKTRQKRIFKSTFNILFGVCLGIGLTLGLQFVLDRLFINQLPEPSPSPIIQPSPLGINLADIPYKNEELGIEVLYPLDWSRNLDLEGVRTGVKLISFESDDLANIIVEIKQIDPLEKNVSLEKVLEKSLAETKVSHPDFVSLGQTKSSVSDLPAYIVDGNYSFQESLSLKMKVLQAVFINESREFYVNMTLAAKEENWPDYRSAYERIINEFKLTK